MFRKIMRGFIALLLSLAGFSTGWYIILGQNPVINLSESHYKYSFLALITIIPGIIGYVVAPWLMNKIVELTEWIETRLQKTPAQDLAGGAIGLLTGLVVANLLASSISGLPWVGHYLPIVLSVVLGYLGLNIGVKKKDEILGLFSFIPKLATRERGSKQDRAARFKVLDTSVIIDGRIADICKTGFIEGTLLIPGFVLEELQHIADSSDLLKRNRGRRGLDILNKIRKELDIVVQIDQRDYDDMAEVDSKLIRLAKEVCGKIITNDYNLNKVSELQGVPVLNINELANAIKPVVLPGEEMVVQVIKDGKEVGQGVAYLDDGTMIVVDGGKKFIGQTMEVLVTSVLQTAAGRMIFAKPKLGEYNRSPVSQHGRLNEVNAIV